MCVGGGVNGWLCNIPRIRSRSEPNIKSTQFIQRTHAPGGAIPRKGFDWVIVGELDVDEEAGVVVEPVDGHRHRPHQERAAPPLGRFLRLAGFCCFVGFGLGREGGFNQPSNHAIKSTNQPTNQPNDQSIKSTNQPTNQLPQRKPHLVAHERLDLLQLLEGAEEVEALARRLGGPEHLCSGRVVGMWDERMSEGERTGGWLAVGINWSLCGWTNEWTNQRTTDKPSQTARRAPC